MVSRLTSTLFFNDTATTEIYTAIGPTSFKMKTDRSTMRTPSRRVWITRVSGLNMPGSMIMDAWIMSPSRIQRRWKPFNYVAEPKALSLPWSPLMPWLM